MTTRFRSTLGALGAGALVALGVAPALAVSPAGTPAAATGSTATVAADVWMRPEDSVAGTRCTRCTPASCLRCA